MDKILTPALTPEQVDAKLSKHLKAVSALREIRYANDNNSEKVAQSHTLSYYALFPSEAPCNAERSEPQLYNIKHPESLKITTSEDKAFDNHIMD